LEKKKKGKGRKVCKATPSNIADRATITQAPVNSFATEPVHKSGKREKIRKRKRRRKNATFEGRHEM